LCPEGPGLPEMSAHIGIIGKKGSPPEPIGVQGGGDYGFELNNNPISLGKWRNIPVRIGLRWLF